MATAQMNTVIRHLRRAVLLQDGADKTDGELMASFIDEKDEAAFDALLRRHGPMVLSVCRRIVGNHHDAEDAFQATFLVLARKASSVRSRAMVANWLHGVACRTAMKAKTMTAKRRVRETNLTEMPEAEATPQDQWHDLQPIIDKELSGLPENYRLPIILCDLEGKSIKEATQQLGWPQGTLAGRLARARKILAKRLTQRGVVLSGGALAVVLSEKAASACVPVALADLTTKAAVAVAAGQAAAPSLVSAKVATLMEGVLKTMLLVKLKTVWAVLLVLGVLAFGGSMAARNSAVAQQISAEKAKKPANRPVDSSKASDERKTLQGTWHFVSFERGGNFQSEDEIKKLQPEPFEQMVFTAHECVWQRRPGGNAEVVKFRYTLQATENVKWIEFRPQNDKDGRDVKCVYSFQGPLSNELRMAFPHELTKDGRLFAYHYFKRHVNDDKKAISKAKNPPTSLEETRLSDDATEQKLKDLPKTLDEQKLHGEWIANTQNENGGMSLIFGPGKTVRRIMESPHNRLDDTGTYSVDWTKNPYHLDLNLNVKNDKLPVMKTIMELVEPGKLRIEIGGGDEGRPKAFTDETIVLIRKERHPPGSKQAAKDADRDIEIAESYRRTGKFASAHFYYQLVKIRYPGTNFAEKAKHGLEDLKKHRIRLPDGSEAWEAPEQPLQPQPPPTIQEAPKASRDVLELRQQVKALESRLAVLENKEKPQPPAKTGLNPPAYGQEIHEHRQQVKNLESRLAAIEAKRKKVDAKKELPKVGRIIVLGNTKLDSAIRKATQLVPGQILDDKALRTAEKNLAAFDATIEVIDTNDPGFKDILVRVRKK